jgi:Domain of unknown function (DUF4288)
MWFAANLLFESVRPDHPENESLWEESIVLVRAESEEQARQDAEVLGKAGEHEYIAANGDLVRWVFRQVEKLCAIETLEHGTELFSRFLSRQEVESLLSPFEE